MWPPPRRASSTVWTWPPSLSDRWIPNPGYRERILEQLPAGVELTTIRVLRAVEAAEEPLTIGDLATALGVDPSTASRFADRVAERGEVERRPRRQDRRRTRLALTDAGRRTLAVVTRARRDVLSDVTAGWDAADVTALTELLQRLGAGYAELAGRA